MRGKVYRVSGGVTAAQGFEAAAAAAGIKYHGRTDMALICSDSPCTAAGVFTSNVVKAAPVLWNRKIVRESEEKVHAVVVNSGIANACTGEEGLQVCEETAEAAAKTLGIPVRSVLIGSTGVIGMQIPMERIRAGIDCLAASKSASIEAGEAASKAIMTTDTVNKQAAVQIVMPGRGGMGADAAADGKDAGDACGCCADGEGGSAAGGPDAGDSAVDGVTVTIGGMAKGSGMIHPGMCTMLAYVTTDAAISKALLQKAVSEIADDTFNMISVDGDMSTNDTLLVLANGAAGNAEITSQESAAYAAFRVGLFTVCRTLAMAMAGDGEGATRLIESQVIHMDTTANAKVLAKSVIQSNLTKAAVFGRDANWGRILCALGYAGVSFDPDKVELFFEANGRRIVIFAGGRAADYSEEEASDLLSKEKVTIISDMNMGEASATAWGCDLTYDYVRINADYRS